MKQIRLEEETQYLSSRDWLRKHNVEYFQRQCVHFEREIDDDRFRLITVFVGEERAMMILLLDRSFMLEILAINTNPEIPVPSITKLLLRQLQRPRIISYAREYDEQYVEMGLPVVSINYARPIIPGRPDRKRFTANVAALYQEKEQFRSLVRTTFGDDPVVESALEDNGMMSLLVLEDGTQVAAIVTRGEKRWAMSDPLILRDNGIPVNDTVFARFVENLMACLPKGDMLIYSSTVQAANNRVTWLIMNSFVPESYLHHRALKEN